MVTWELILFELKPVPDFLLQYAGVLGIMSIFLLMTRRVETSRRTAGLHFALVLGMSGFAISALLARYLPPPSAAPIRFDLLFLAGVIGGWRGGAAAFACIYGARVIFGNGALPIGAGLDMVIIVSGGIMMHRWFARIELADITPRQIVTVWAGMVSALVASALVTVWLSQLPSGSVPFTVLPYKNAVGSTVRRVVMGPASLLFVSCLFAILRFEALDRRNRRIELIRMRVDPITQLPNRRALLNHVDALLKDPTIQHVTLLTVTAQNYADMLLTRGHDWGDKFLLKLNQAIQSEPVHGMLRDFKPNVFLFTDLTLMLVLQKIEAREFDRRGLASALQQELTLTMGAGGPKGVMPLLSLCVAECDRSKHVTGEKALRDVSLHLLNLAPHAGNTVHYLQHNFADSAAHDAQVLARLTTWIDTHSPPLAYQPKCDLSSQKVLGAEALLRMVDNAGNAVPPQEVVALATRHQLLAAFEWCTLERVVQDAYTWMMAGNAKPLSVNISGASLVSADFGHRLRHLMDAHHLPRSAITLELTEVSPIPDVDAVRENARILLDSGIHLSLDDFGSGYSGLTVLARFHFAEVKIDQGMVALIAQPRMKSAIQLAMESAQRYGATFVAEGVETQAQSDTLSAMGIDRGQGYLFAEALSIEALITYDKTGQLPAKAKTLTASEPSLA